jgi:hypothetical protein
MIRSSKATVGELAPDSIREIVATPTPTFFAKAR